MACCQLWRQALGDPENKGEDEWKPLEGRVQGVVPNPSD